MAHRLTAIVTRTGDDGTTGLGDGTRVPKNHVRVQALGDVDELNAQLGMLLTEALPQDIRVLMIAVQHELFNLGGELAMPGRAFLQDAAVTQLDAAVARHNATLPALKEFVLPGGSRGAALAHVARTVARRAERTLVALAADSEVRETPRLYLNRLSDLLFVLARVLNHVAPDAHGAGDVYWNSRRLQETAAVDGSVSDADVPVPPR